MLFLFLLFFAFCECSQVSSALYNGYALVGNQPSSTDNSKQISYVAIISSNNTDYSISSVFHVDDTPGFGASVALGSAPSGSTNITVAVVGGKQASGIISVFDANCTGSSDCDPFTYFSGGSNCEAGTSVAAGYGFVVSTCSSNLLKRRQQSSAFTACIIQDFTTANCTTLQQINLPNNTGCPSSPRGGQLVISAIDARDNMAAVAFCAVCSEMTGNSLSLTHVSGFAAYKVDYVDGVKFVGLVTSKNRTESCPTSIAVNSQWVILGYGNEGAIDFYASPKSTNDIFSYHFQQTITDPEPQSSLGTFVDCDESLAIASSKGSAASASPGSAVMFEITRINNNFNVHQLQATIPSINYPVVFDYTFNVNLYQGTILVVTQDRNLINWGFDVFDACDDGMQWSPSTGTCVDCPAGQHKATISGAANFDLCTPCPAGNYSTTPKTCQNLICSKNQFCPAGSSVPINPIANYIIKSNPSPVASDPLDFENTFYYSCYPYFVAFLTGIIAIAIPLCCSWPGKTPLQKKVVSSMLVLNFFYWPTGEEEGFFMDQTEEEKRPLLEHSGSDGAINGDKDLLVVFEDYEKIRARRRRHVSQFLGSLCSYFFVATLFLMIAFGTIFMSDNFNSSVTVDLQTIDESTTRNGMLQIYAALEKIDSCPFDISLTLVGYNGECTGSMLELSVAGCHSLNYQYPCNHTIAVGPVNVTNSNATHCSIVVSFGASILEQDSSFSFFFTKADFYAQQVQYNISTANSPSLTTFTGNSYISSAVQPAPGEILRGNATVELLTILTYISDCESQASSKDYFVKGMVRVNEEICVSDNSSYKSLSFLSNSMDVVNSELYSNTNSSNFQFNVVFVKSPFYKNVQQSYFVSYGTILTITMLAALDVYWLVEALVPWLGYLIYKIQSAIMFCIQAKKRTRKRKP